MALGILGALLPRYVTRPAQRRLLSILVLERGHDLERDCVIDRMWRGKPPASARNALHVHINGLRSTLPANLITTTPGGYRFDLDGQVLDVVSFDQLATDALDSADHGTRLGHATRALALWRGAPYAELAEDNFARPEIARLTERRLNLIELRVGALLALGRTTEALPDLERLVLDQPLRERLWGYLMLARYWTGCQSEALRAYQDARSVLADELGIEPCRELNDLEELILLNDPTIDAYSAAPIPHNQPTTRAPRPVTWSSW